MGMQVSNGFVTGTPAGRQSSSRLQFESTPLITYACDTARTIRPKICRYRIELDMG
jgi:hypothetical protein